MPPPDMRNGGSARQPNTPATAKIRATITKPEHTNRSASEKMLTAYAVLYLAVGEAMFDWVVVRVCPLCRHAHRHVLFEAGASVIERSPACRKHLVYRVVITDVVPTRSRRRGAA